MSSAPIFEAQNMLNQQNQQQNRELDLQQKIGNIIANMLQITNDLAYDIATLEDEKCQRCPIVEKTRQLIRQLKELIEIQRKFRK